MSGDGEIEGVLNGKLDVQRYFVEVCVSGEKGLEACMSECGLTIVNLTTTYLIKFIRCAECQV